MKLQVKVKVKVKVKMKKAVLEEYDFKNSISCACEYRDSASGMGALKSIDIVVLQ